MCSMRNLETGDVLVANNDVPAALTTQPVSVGETELEADLDDTLGTGSDKSKYVAHF